MFGNVKNKRKKKSFSGKLGKKMDFSWGRKENVLKRSGGSHTKIFRPNLGREQAENWRKLKSSCEDLKKKLLNRSLRKIIYFNSKKKKTTIS